MRLLCWQPFCWTTDTCCLARNGAGHVLVMLLVVLCHFGKLCFIHRRQVDHSSVPSEHSLTSALSHSCPGQYLRNCVQVVLLFPRDVCSLSACSTSHRILQIPGDHCLFLSMQYNFAFARDVTGPLVTLPPLSKSSTCKISQ